MPACATCTRRKPRRSRPANPKATAARAAPPAIAWTTLRPFTASGASALGSISTKSSPSTALCVPACFGSGAKVSSTPDLNDLDDITRFNETIDQSLAKAVASYTHRVDQSRRMFLAILSHDLRNPLSCISMSAQLASLRERDRSGVLRSSLADRNQRAGDFAADPRPARLCCDRAGRAYAARHGAGESWNCFGREVLDELKAANPNRTLRFDARGDLDCSCDGARLRQVISNLLGNALEHGSKNGDVELSITSEGPDIILAVRNQGPPIAPDVLPTIFDPLVRDTSTDAQRHRRVGSVGLGLYIAHEIVTSHGGTIDVTSSAESGTVFTVRIPCQQA